MVDPLTAVSTIKLVTGSIDTLKRLGDLAKQTQNVELKEGIHALREELLSVKEGLFEVKNENLSLKEENKELRDRISSFEVHSEDLILKDMFYFTKDGKGPYCPQCWESKRKRNRLSVSGAKHTCSDGSCSFSYTEPMAGVDPADLVPMEIPDFGISF